MAASNPKTHLKCESKLSTFEAIKCDISPENLPSLSKESLKQYWEFIVSRRKKLVLKMELGDCDNSSLPDFMACGRLALPDFCGLCTCTIFQIQNGCKQSKNSSKM